MRPVIGLTAYHDQEKAQLYLRDNYLRSVLDAGGLPVLLPQIDTKADAEAYLDCMDALLLTGGGDIDPKYYKEARQEACGRPDAGRDTSEMLLITSALARCMPIMGICRGCQVLGVALGAKLIQDIETERGIPRIVHSQEPPYDQPAHIARLTEGGLLQRLTGKACLQVNSSHHQALRDAPDSIQIEAMSDDGIIEGFSMKGNDSVFAVQFHPEHMTVHDPDARALFRHLVDAASQACGQV